MKRHTSRLKISALGAATFFLPTVIAWREALTAGPSRRVCGSRATRPQPLHVQIQRPGYLRCAYLLFAAWAGILLTQCTAALEATVEGAGAGEGAGEGGGAPAEDPLSKEELEEFSALLKKCHSMEQVTWDRRLATHLMAMCDVGTLNSGARQTIPVVQSYDSKGAKSPRVCSGGVCAKPATSKSTSGRYKSTRTHGVCWCNVCSGSKGKARALYLCLRCNKTPTAHVAAAAAADKKKKFKPVEWAESS